MTVSEIHLRQTTAQKQYFTWLYCKNFFSPEQLPDLKGDTLLDSALKVTLPKSKEFQHRFDQLTSDDTRISHDLSSYAAQIKNSSFVFHSLSEVPASQFDDILDERDVRISTLNIFNWDWWLNALPQPCAILSLILGLYLFYRMRILAAMILHSKTVCGIPLSLTFHHHHHHKRTD